MEARVRFAPSPTGEIHIGNIRTAIFNWLFVRNSGGKFLLRIEDTDKERSTQEAIDKLLDCMEWLGLDHDEEIFYQSQNAANHIQLAEKLIESGNAYRLAGDSSPVLFRIPRDSDGNPAVRTAGNAELELHPDCPVKIDFSGVSFAQVSKKGKAVETSASLAGFHELKVFDKNGACIFEIEEHIADILGQKKDFSLENCVKFSFQRREVFFKDTIKGELAKPLDSMKDLVIVRSDGSPVFHLANVCDDIEQNVSHIIRGDDHVENTYRHIFLFQALNYDLPVYGHLPMIINQSGKPYSKRDGDAFVGDFRTKGYLPESLFNYLSLLGWSPGDDREKLSKNELIESFSLDRVLSAPAQFDARKLDNLNGLYISEKEPDKFVDELLAYSKENNTQGWISSVQSEDFKKIAILMQSRTKRYSQMNDWKYFFFKPCLEDSPLIKEVEDKDKISQSPEESFRYDWDSVRKFLSGDDVRNAVKELINSLEAEPELTVEMLEQTIRNAEKTSGLSEGKLNQPLRVALSGCTVGAGIYETICLIREISGIEQVIFRLKLAIKEV